MGNPSLFFYSCFIFTWMESNVYKGWRVLWLYFPTGLFLLAQHGSLTELQSFALFWAPYFLVLGQACTAGLANAQVHLYVWWPANLQNNLPGSTRSVCPPHCIFKMIFICTFQQLVGHFVTVIIPYIPVHITSAVQVTNLTSSRESLWFLVLQVPMDHGWTYCFGPDWCLLVLLLGHKNWACFWRVFFVQKNAILKAQTLMKTHKNFAQKKNVPILVFLILGVPKSNQFQIWTAQYWQVYDQVIKMISFCWMV